jgi:hypothetical protein
LLRSQLGCTGVAIACVGQLAGSVFGAVSWPGIQRLSHLGAQCRILFGEQRDGGASLAGTARAAHTVHVGLRHVNRAIACCMCCLL